MAHISTLHELAQSGLRDLAARRVMPSGYNQSLSRRMEVMALQLAPLLAEILASVPNTLMPRPAHGRWQQLIAEATQERLLKGMVSNWVSLLVAEPKPDQHTAYALATVREQIAGAARMMGRLEAMVQELEDVQAIIAACSFDETLDVADTRDAMMSLQAQALALQKKLDRYQENLETEIAS